MPRVRVIVKALLVVALLVAAVAATLNLLYYAAHRDGTGVLGQVAALIAILVGLRLMDLGRSGSALPKFCLECGAALVEREQTGAGRFASEDWAVLECPVYTQMRGGEWRRHYSKIVKHGPRTAKFDPLTGAPR